MLTQYNYTTTASFEYNDCEYTAKISVICHLDEHAIDTYDSEDVESIRENISNGSVTPVVVCVTANFGGLEGTDYLGGVFATQASDIATCVAEHQMTEAALIELKNNISAFLTAIERN